MKFSKIFLVAVLGGLLVASAGMAAEQEFARDNGHFWGWWISVNMGPGWWRGNDVDVSSAGTPLVVRRLRFYSSPEYPNHRWDGMRFALFSFSSAPGSMIWPPSGIPKWGIGSGENAGWFDVSVGWQLPAGTTKFVAALDQYYNNPDFDPAAGDIGPNTNHTWVYQENAWNLSNGSNRDFNLMLRVVVEKNTAVQPASLGRVKAVYK